MEKNDHGVDRLNTPEHLDREIGYRSLLLFTLPSILGSLIEPFAEMVDTAFVGHLGSAPLSALAASNILFAISTWLFNFLLYVAGARVALAFGTRDDRGIREALRLAVLLSLTIGVILACILYVAQDLLLIGLMDLSGERLALARDYYDTRLLAVPCILLFSAMLGVWRGMQRVRAAFLLVAICTLSNIMLTFLCLHTFQLGMAGVALGTVLSHLLCASAASLLLIREWFFRVKVAFWGPIEWLQARDFGKKAGFQFLRTLALCSSFLICTSLASSHGTYTAAAHQVLLQFWLLGAYVLDGVAITATSVGGRLWGAADYSRWLVMSKRLLTITIFSGCMFSTVYIVFPHISRVFTPDPHVLAIVQELWWLIACFQLPNAVSFLLDGLLFGQQGFAIIARRMWEGLVFVFLPIIIVSSTVPHITPLWGIWLAICGLNLYRLLSLSRFLLKQAADIRQIGLSKPAV